jgi:phage gp36-like protein
MYATLDDLLAAFGEDELLAITDRGNTGAVDAALAGAALSRAASEADSYLARRYAVPVADPVPPVLTAAVCDIARYRLTGGPASETDPILERYRQAVQWLTRIAAGAADLPGLTLPDGGSVAGVAFSTGRRVFDRRPVSEEDA